MATVTVLTKEAMEEIRDNSVTTVTIVNGELFITKGDGTQISAGTLVEAPDPIPSVTGSRGGNAALASLLTALANQGLIANNTTA